MGALDAAALVVIFILIIAVAVVIVALGTLPGKIARRRGHPCPDAVNAASWIGLATGVFWPVAFIWAFLPIPHRGEGSAEMASELGSFPGYADDQDNMLRVMRNHRLAARGEARESEEYEGLRIRPVPIDHSLFKAGKVRLKNAAGVLERAVAVWDEAFVLGTRHGYRNAQTTVIAPTGTIGLLMDCDTTGVEPDFALVKFKKLAGGGYFKIANESLRPALTALSYSPEKRDDIVPVGAITVVWAFRKPYCWPRASASSQAVMARSRRSRALSRLPPCRSS